MKNHNRKRNTLIITLSFAVTVMILITGVVKTNIYNSTGHTAVFEDSDLFSEQDRERSGVTVTAGVRDSTWTKAFDLNNEGLEEHNYQAYTVDFYVNNNTNDEVRKFSLKINFNRRERTFRSLPA